MSERDFWKKEATLDDIAGKPPVSLKRCLDAIIPEIAPSLKGDNKNILEIGCGTGRLTFPIQKKFPKATVIGIDISLKFLSVARKQAYQLKNKKPIFYLTDNLMGLDKYDAIYSMLMFQHIPNVEKFSYIMRASASLKEGGVFRFQYVEGTQDSPNNHDCKLEDIERWCSEAELKIIYLNMNLIHDRWYWITAQK